MSILLDTHVFLWWVLDDSRLGAAARRTIAAGEAQIGLSLVSIWEIAIKQRLGRRVSGAKIDEIMDVAYGQDRFFEVGLARMDLAQLEALPLHHRDPFDRMLVAQAAARGLTLLTGDRAFTAYEISLMDARA